MSNVTGIFISAKQLSKGVVRRFCDVLEKRVADKESLPDDGESFEGDGVALMVGAEVHGLYVYKGFASLQGDTTLYYPYGGMLIEDRYTRRHQSLIENFTHELKSDSKKVKILVSLDQQPMQKTDGIAEDEAFWLALGFSPLDVQVRYQGAIKYDNAQDKSDFSISKYEGGDDATNLQLCQLYQEAYKRFTGIPELTPEIINKQLSIPSCSYLVMRYKDELIGQVTLFVSQQECYVDSIYVKRSYWGTGAADKLGQCLLNYAKTKDCQTISGTAASNNRASCALMERFGLVAQYQVKRMTLSL